MIRAKTQFIWSCGFIWGLRLFHHTMYAKAEFEKQDNGQTLKPFVYARNWFLARDLKTNYNTYACFDRIKKLGHQNRRVIEQLEANFERRNRLSDRPSRITSLKNNYIALINAIRSK